MTWGKMRFFGMIVIGAFFFIVSSVFGETTYWVGGSTTGDPNLWNVADNWDPVMLPTIANSDVANIFGPGGPLIDSTVSAECYRMYGPQNSTGSETCVIQVTGGTFDLYDWRFNDNADHGPGEVQMSGGTVSITRDHLHLGYRGEAVFTMSDGTLNITRDMYIAENGTATGTLNMSGGTVNVDGNILLGTRGKGYLNMTGGTLNTTILSQCDIADAGLGSDVVMDGGDINVDRYMRIGRRGPGTWIMNGGTITLAEALVIGEDDSLGNGYLEINGGTITFGRDGYTDLLINSNNGSFVNMTGTGMMVIRGDAVDYVEELIADKKLKAYNGLGWFEVTYDVVADQTTIVSKVCSYAYSVAADLNDDKQVDLYDFSVLAEAWLQTSSEIPISLVREGDLPYGHPFWPSPQLKIITGTDKHRSRGSGLVILPDKWLLFWREGAHHHDDPASTVKMAESYDEGRTLENIKTLYSAAGHDGVEWLDIRARIMGNGRIGIYGGRQDSTDGSLKKPLFAYSDDMGQTWTYVSLDHFEIDSSCPSFTFNRFPASVGGHDTEGYILFWRGSDELVHIAYTVDNGLTWQDQLANHSGASPGEMSVVRLGETDRWVMIGRTRTEQNAVHTSTDLFNWDGPYYTDKTIGGNPSTIVYNEGFVTWIAASRPYHYSDSDIHAQLVNGEIFRGLVTCTVEAEALWKNPSYWPEWSILMRLPVHFDGTFVNYEDRWYMIFGAVEGPPQMTGTTGKTYSRLGIMTARLGGGI